VAAVTSLRKEREDEERTSPMERKKRRRLKLRGEGGTSLLLKKGEKGGQRLPTRWGSCAFLEECGGRSKEKRQSSLLGSVYSKDRVPFPGGERGKEGGAAAWGGEKMVYGTFARICSSGRERNTASRLLIRINRFLLRWGEGWLSRFLQGKWRTLSCRKATIS